ncbi:5' nucleotidase, NT5C type [Paenibacillus xylaniclasticus]|uniref:5' nucleotidase, NT5C type n=1 Tax=Paenibacillus xylaniclasticus TaxID=588083 RepID=UPI000FDBD8C8|nr:MULTISPECIES: hypothetical protein [Paenibacillus]GFN33519.1 hypothetical protein PCURB6_37790 [Paenibacillus curdlanolyticus]
MHPGIDLDNTVLDATAIFLEYYNRASGLSLTAADVKSYYIYEAYGWDIDQVEEVYLKYGYDIHWHSQPLPMAADSIRKLSEEHRISFITARPERYRDVSIDWLNRHRFVHDNVVCTEYKLAHCMEANIDLLIDDGPQYAEPFAKARKPIILFDQPYNRDVEPNSFVYRAADWNEVMRHIQMLTAASSHVSQQPIRK